MRLYQATCETCGETLTATSHQAALDHLTEHEESEHQ